MNPVLVPCPSCDRHVRSNEAACPFCASPLPGDLAGRAVPPAPRRLSRAAALAFGASLTVAACGTSVVVDNSGGTSGGGGSTTTDGTGGFGAPLYGGPFPDAGDGGQSTEGGPPADAGDGGSDGGDGGHDGGIAPPYGVPAYGGPTPPPPPK